MDGMSLREAAARTGRSITTLRRYIRGGRLRAELRDGRYGPEYVLTEGAMVASGLEPRGQQALEPTPRESVPLSLFQELQMKHEQLLVQYGMMRAGGLQVLELRAELDTRREQLDQAHGALSHLRDRSSRETAELRRRLREAELELEGRALELEALREKVRVLERMARPGGARPEGSLDRRFGEVLDQMLKVDRMGAPDDDPDRRDH